MTARHATRALFCILLACLTACAKAPSPPEALPEARTLWEAFLLRHQPPDDTSHLFVDAVLRVTSRGETRRMTAELWGAPLAETPVIRLDLYAGVGALLVSARQEQHGVLALFPQEGWGLRSDSAAMLGRRLALPCGLRSLAFLVAGDYAALLPKSFQTSETTGDGHRYTFAPPWTVRSLTLNARGLPLGMKFYAPAPDRDGGAGLWDLAFSRHDEDGRARRIDIAGPDGQEALVLIKDVQRVAPYGEAALSLTLPPGTPVRGLEALP